MLALAELMDGNLLPVTNTPDLTAQGEVDPYEPLADIQRGFRVLKSQIEIGPAFHRLPERIKAHASLCFIALNPYRFIRQRLQKPAAICRRNAPSTSWNAFSIIKSGSTRRPRPSAASLACQTSITASFPTWI